jgi:short-subunit dehydrogenase
LGNPSSVVFTSSIAGSIALATASIYSATKSAVISLGRALAVELAQRGVRVYVLSPGLSKTLIERVRAEIRTFIAERSVGEAVEFRTPMLVAIGYRI